MSRLGKAATCCSVFICIVAIAVGALLAAGNARRAARLSKYASKPGVIPELPLSAHIIHTVGDVLEATGLYSVDLSYEALHAAATAATGGLTDFGEADVVNYTTNARALTTALQASRPHMSFTGKLLSHYGMVRTLIGRLQTQELLRQHGDAIRAQSIDRPLIVIGLPRSGTSAITNLLAQHHKLHPMRTYAGLYPAGLPGEPLTRDMLAAAESDPRLPRARGELVGTLYTLPEELTSNHPFHAENAEEDIMLMQFAFAKSCFHTILDIPAYNAFLAGRDHHDEYAYLKLLLQLLQWQQNVPSDKQWLMKAPHHMLFLRTLLDTLPDAKIVWIHRDVAPSMRSYMRFRAQFVEGSMTNGTVEAPAIGQNILEFFHDALAHSLDYRHSLSATEVSDRFIDVAYEDFVADPTGTSCDTLAAAGLPCTADDRARIAAWIADNPSHGHRIPKPSLAAWGVYTESSFEEQVAAAEEALAEGKAPAIDAATPATTLTKSELEQRVVHLTARFNAQMALARSQTQAQAQAQASKQS